MERQMALLCIGASLVNKKELIGKEYGWSIFRTYNFFNNFFDNLTVILIIFDK